MWDIADLADIEDRVAKLQKRIAEQRELIARGRTSGELANQVLRSYEILLGDATRRRDLIQRALLLQSAR
jgi:hypothetical protein